MTSGTISAGTCSLTRHLFILYFVHVTMVTIHLITDIEEDISSSTASFLLTGVCFPNI